MAKFASEQTVGRLPDKLRLLSESPFSQRVLLIRGSCADDDGLITLPFIIFGLV